MNARIRFLGLDVHKETIAVAVAEDGSEPQLYSTIANRPEAVRKLVREIGGPGLQVVAAYEAGPTGYAVYRQLVKLGFDARVVAPSLIPRAPSDKVKTDHRDAVRLAQMLRSGDLVSVWIPDDAHEALRDLVRSRADAKVDPLRARHRLSKFLLRRGLVPGWERSPGLAPPWTPKVNSVGRHSTPEKRSGAATCDETLSEGDLWVMQGLRRGSRGPWVQGVVATPT